MHNRLRIHAFGASRGQVNANLPDNCGILQATTVNNNPGLLLTADADFSTNLVPRVFHIFEIGAGETIPGPHDTNFIGAPSNGTKCYAIFEWTGVESAQMASRAL